MALRYTRMYSQQKEKKSRESSQKDCERPVEGVAEKKIYREKLHSRLLFLQETRSSLILTMFSSISNRIGDHAKPIPFSSLLLTSESIPTYL